MNEIYPALQRHPSLLSQLLHGALKRPSRSFVIRRAALIGPVRENCLVEMLRSICSIRIRHSPQSSDNAAEPTVLHRSCEM